MKAAKVALSIAFLTLLFGAMILVLLDVILLADGSRQARWDHFTGREKVVNSFVT